MSPVFDCSSEERRHEGLTKAAAAVREGQLVVFPTDTLYGVAADAFNESAVQALLAAKGRGRHMPPPVLVGDIATVDGLAIDVPDYARRMLEEFWPGPLTVVLKAQPSLRWDLGDTNGTVALRMPDHDLALELLRDVGPLAVSSANLTGWPASRTMVEAATQLGASVFIYLDGGPVGGGLPSTIVDCTTDTPSILRDGAVSADQLEPFRPKALADDALADDGLAEDPLANDALSIDDAPADPDNPADAPERPTTHE